MCYPIPDLCQDAQAIAEHLWTLSCRLERTSHREIARAVSLLTARGDTLALAVLQHVLEQPQTAPLDLAYTLPVPSYAEWYADTREDGS